MAMYLHRKSYQSGLPPVFRKTFLPIDPIPPYICERRLIDMKKRLLISLFCLFLLFTLMLTPAQASASGVSGALARIHSIEQQNNRCGFQDILKATGVKIVNEANDRIEAVIIQSCRLAEKAKTDAEVRAIICSMLTRTKSISITARAAAAVCGVKAVCEYVPVEIGGYTVMVDPLRVVLI